MFDTLGSFSVVFFILSAILILMVIFEKQCLALEDKLDEKIRQRKRAAAHAKNVKNPTKAKRSPQTKSHTDARRYTRQGTHAA